MLSTFEMDFEPSKQRNERKNEKERGDEEGRESTYLIRKELCLVTLSKPFHPMKGGLSAGRLLQSFSSAASSFFPNLSTHDYISSTGC